MAGDDEVADVQRLLDRAKAMAVDVGDWPSDETMLRAWRTAEIYGVALVDGDRVLDPFDVFVIDGEAE